MKLKSRHTARFYVILCCGIVMLFTAIADVTIYAQSDKNNLQTRKAQLEKEIAEMNIELEQTKKNKSANLNQIILINKKIRKREELIQEINQEVDNLDGQVQNLSDTISKMSRNLYGLKEEYAQIVYSTYRNRGAYNELMFIFSAHNFNQAYKRLKYVQQYTEYRKQQVSAIMAGRVELAYKKLEFEKQKSSKLTLKHSQEQERNMLAIEKKQKDDKVKNLTSQEKKLLGKLRDNEVALNKLQTAIESLVAAEIKKANEEKARKAATLAEADRKAKLKAEADKKAAGKTESKTVVPVPAQPEVAVKTVESKPVAAKVPVAKSNSMSVTAEDVALTGSFAGNKGRLPSPVNKGSVVSTFGEHPHAEFQNIKIKNNGIDITSASGSQAKVVFDGEVSSVLYIANLNYVVIVRHGDYLTVYSNLEEVSVKKGDRLKTGQALGTISTAQGENRSRLHFELWLGTIVQNPEGWIRI